MIIYHRCTCIKDGSTILERHLFGLTTISKAMLVFAYSIMIAFSAVTDCII